MKNGQFGSPEEVLDQALAALSEKRPSRREAVRRVHEFRQKHQLSLGFDILSRVIHRVPFDKRQSSLLKLILASV
jgi:hypothetical protein